MEHLEPIASSGDAAWYAIRGGPAEHIERYVVSTEPGRTVCNLPELAGVAFSRTLGRAMRTALRTAPFRSAITETPEHRICVLSFLRGGLNFDLRGALADAYQMNNHVSAFMSSQRSRVEGRWQVREDMYRKLRIPASAVLLVGDVVATGTTLANGLQVLFEHLEAIDSSLERLVFFTIGCRKLEDHLAAFDAKCRERFSGYQGSVAVYLEGRFTLAEGGLELRIAIPGTDLVKPRALLAPEFALSQYEALSYPLERCVVYDAGSRAFDVPHYLEDVLEYWRELRNLARRGWPLLEALRERWPDTPGKDTWLTRAWNGIPHALQNYEQARNERWQQLSDSAALGPEALEALCDERIATLSDMGSR